MTEPENKTEPETPRRRAKKADSKPTNGLMLQDQILTPNLFVLPVNSAVVYPTMMAPISVSEPRFIATVEEAINRQRVIGVLLSRDTATVGNETQANQLYTVGIAAKILKRLKMPDGSINLLVHSLKRFKVKRYISDQPHLVVEAEYINDAPEKTTEMDALSRMVIQSVKKLSEVNPFFTDEMKLALINAPNAGVVADLVAFALALPKSGAQDFLETLDVKVRFEKLLVHLRREQDVADLQKKIQDDVSGKINTAQREFFLKEQLKTIKKELGLEEDGKTKAARTFRERINELNLPPAILQAALEELEKFEVISEQSPEYNISRTYLETVCSLPWTYQTPDQFDIAKARSILNEDHFGLERVKERIIEFLAVRKLRKESTTPKGSILCLVGPPGVGKTSIGKSVAKSLGRNFYRFSLGGMRDEAEIKGHRRTYIGAMPGKVLQAMRRAGSKNPVILLDEIDKLGSSFQGDPASALLEVLDPEQNSAFLDHYLDLPFDLSHVLFVATANSVSTIPAALLDRMEVIDISGYTLEEKEKIATQYVIPRVLEENGLKPSQVLISQAALRKVLQDYAREPGLRSLQQLIGKIARKAAARLVEVPESPRPRAIRIKPESLSEWLGPQRFYNELAERITLPGVVVGLAWTAMGGDILFIEASDLPGSGQLKITGQLGEVMTESAAIAFSYIKKKISNAAHSGSSGIPEDFFKTRDFHIHIPAGAIPKDGPSAGITLAATLYSLMTGRKAKQRVAMTGELSLIGKVLPVGGIKEKLLAAKRSGIREIILPKLNQKDLSEIPSYVLDGLKLHWVSHVEEVFPLVLETVAQKKPNGAFDRRRRRLDPQSSWL